MIGCRCPAPPAGADGGPWPSDSPSTGLPRQRMPGGVLDLSALRPRPVLLQPGLPRPSATPAAAPRQLPPPAESGGTARPPRPPAGIPAALCPEDAPGARDGSRFPFDRFSGTIPLWDAEGSTGSGCLVGNPRWPRVALRHLRPPGPFRRSLPTDSTSPMSDPDDPSRDPR